MRNRALGPTSKWQCDTARLRALLTKGTGFVLMLAARLEDIITVEVGDEVGDRDPVVGIRHAAAIVGF